MLPEENFRQHLILQNKEKGTVPFSLFLSIV